MKSWQKFILLAIVIVLVSNGAIAPYPLPLTVFITHPTNPEKWITPDNLYVITFANKITINETGQILYQGEPFQNNYVHDVIQFGKSDYWQMPEEYLQNGMKGDCEDYAVTITSALIHKGISTKINLGVFKNYKDNKESVDAWTEYQIGNKTYITGTSSVMGTVFIEKDNFYNSYNGAGYNIITMYEINQSSFKSLYEDW